jgi:hypothetical protein
VGSQIDSATSTFTVKSRIAYQEVVSELKQFKPDEGVGRLVRNS